jgi:(1->4)-alpha-D-glucan 1-alpha-D-glucosylmutase
MLGTSTHDTKRSEDVRLRIAALSEVPELWDKAIRRWSKLNKKYRTEVDDSYSPSRSEEYLIYQALLGTWPLEPLKGDERAAYVERIQKYMLKAIKEAKINSSWIEPNEDWEAAILKFVHGILNGNPTGKFCADLAETAEIVAQLGAMNSLAQTVVKCTAPGVPDFYQGTEIWDFSLVDPDNRRPVDYSARQRLLESLAGANPGELLRDWKTGRIKLFLIQRLLTFRAAHRPLFLKGSYNPLVVTGKKANHVIAFERRLGAHSLVVAVPRLTHSLGPWPVGDAWEQTFLTGLGNHGDQWDDVLSRRPITLTDRIGIPMIFSDLPLAVLHQKLGPE